MTYSIQSEKLKLKINSFGAEICSITDYNNTEYLWQADEKVWKRHSPVLFPFISNTATKKYSYDGVEYALPNHGFARDSEFTLLFCKENSIEFSLSYSEETLKIYPFKFTLHVNYTVEENKVKVSYSVVNTDDKDIFFFIGGHPAFVCPLNNNDKYSEYSVVFEENETIIQTQLDGTEKTILDNENRIDVSHELFANDSFQKDKPNSSYVSLVSKAYGHEIKVHYDNDGCIAVWSSYFTGDDDKNEDAKFVCLEPWSSTPVFCAENGETDISKMSNAVKLPTDEKYKFSYTIEVKN